LLVCRWVECMRVAFVFAKTQSQQRHRHVGCKHDELMKMMTFAS
jgi:hypothetical protein